MLTEQRPSRRTNLDTVDAIHALDALKKVGASPTMQDIEVRQDVGLFAAGSSEVHLRFRRLGTPNGRAVRRWRDAAIGVAVDGAAVLDHHNPAIYLAQLINGR